MRNIRQQSFAQLFGIKNEKATKLDLLANKREYEKERKLDFKIQSASKYIQ